MKIRPVRAELLHADRHIHMTKLIVAFRNIENAPKKQAFSRCMKFTKYVFPAFHKLIEVADVVRFIKAQRIK